MMNEEGTPALAANARAEIATLLEAGDAAAAGAAAAALHPAELGAVLSALDDDARELLLDQLEPDAIGASLTYIEPHYREEVLSSLDAEEIADALETAPDDVATDVLQELTPEMREEVLEDLPAELREDIGELLVYGEHTAGGRMTGQGIAFHPNQTVGEVIEHLRTVGSAAEQPFYVYLTDIAGRLEGVVNLRQLITAPPGTPVAAVAQRDVMSITADADQEDAARLLKQYNLLALPVVDREQRLVGAVTVDDLIDVLEDEATEDMFRIVGVHEEEDLRAVSRSVRFRLPWLTVNLLTVIWSGFVISLYQGTLNHAASLAIFLPMVAGQGGNAGLQTVTVVVRLLALGQITLRDTMRVVWHETRTGILIGLATGWLLAVVGAIWRGNLWIGLIVGFAVAANTLVGGLSGVLLPMGLYRLRQDPALSASVWLTTFTDTAGFVIFLTLATVAIAHIS